MRTIGLIGGTSWHSTEVYYRTINSIINDHFGNNTNPPLRLINLNQHELHALQARGDWTRIAEIYSEAIRDLASIGCEGILLCANTPHVIFDSIEHAASAKILHIADAVGQRAGQLGLKRLGVVGTIYSLKHDLYGKRLRARFGLDVITPSGGDIEALEKIIKEELTFGVVREESVEFLNEVIRHFKTNGADGVILGCTEFTLLTDKNTSEIPLLDTTELHCRMAANFTLGKGESFCA
jgi:aspartate racemase